MDFAEHPPDLKRGFVALVSWKLARRPADLAEPMGHMEMAFRPCLDDFQAVSNIDALHASAAAVLANL
jgi:hypothetical protein